MIWNGVGAQFHQVYSAFTYGYPELTMVWISALVPEKWFGSAQGALECMSQAGCMPPEPSLTIVSTSWDCGQGPPEVQLLSGCDFSRHTISLCLGALPKGFEKGHTAVGDAGMKLGSVSAGESYSFAFNI